MVVEFGIHFVHIDLNAEQFLILLEELYPSVDVRSAVVAVYHSDKIAVGSGDDIDHLVGLRNVLLKHDHRERRSASRNVTCANLYAIGCGHASAGIAFRRTEWAATLEVTRNVEALCTMLGEHASILTCYEALRQNILELPGEAVRSHELVELAYHLGIVGLGVGIDGNHTRSIADAEDLLVGETPVNVAGEGGEIGDVLNVLFAVQDGLIEVRNAPTEWDVVVEELAELGSSLAGVGVAPGAERCEDLLTLGNRCPAGGFAIGTKGHIAVHHGTDADGGKLLDFAIILSLDVAAKVCIAILNAVPDGFSAIGPESIDELVLPLVTALCDGLVLLVDEDGLDAGIFGDIKGYWGY